MRTYILRRLLLTIPVFFGVTILVFLLVRLVPGDAAYAQLGEYATPEAVAQLRHEYGLDQPLPVQYLSWLGHVARLDFGTSIWKQKPVFNEIMRALPVTIELATMATLLSLLVGIPIAVVSAVKHNSLTDYVVRFMSMLGLAVPNFWLATLLIVYLAIWFSYIPPLQYVDFPTDPAKNLEQLYLPAIALGVSFSAVLMRMARSSLLEVLRSDYIRTARAKGVGEPGVVVRHALKNSMIPVLTLFGLQFARLLGGTVVMEQIFTLPGIGRMTLEAIQFRDYPMLQGIVLLFTVVIVLANLAVDIAYGWFDPRIRYS